VGGDGMVIAIVIGVLLLLVLGGCAVAAAPRGSGWD
jgi:outer membrane lipoprotein-sorting protein